MREIKACGVLVVRGDPVESFLLMKHRDRWDLPKGHLDDDESDVECALRELEEETGIAADDIELIPGFQFVTIYDVQSKRFGEQKKHHQSAIRINRSESRGWRCENRGTGHRQGESQLYRLARKRDFDAKSDR